MNQNVNNKKAVKYNKWGLIFLIPFFVVYVVFQLIPLVTTIYNSFFEHYRSGLAFVGPNFVGLGNYGKLLSDGDLALGFFNLDSSEKQMTFTFSDVGLSAASGLGFRFTPVLGQLEGEYREYVSFRLPAGDCAVVFADTVKL